MGSLEERAAAKAKMQ